MEEKLKEYRALRRRKQLINEAKEKLEAGRQKIVDMLVPNAFKDMGKEKEEEALLMENEEIPQEEEKLLPPEPESPSEVASETSEVESFIEEQPESWQYFTIKWAIVGIVWLALFIVFLKIQFGAVFFVISVLVGICINTRTRPKKRGEVSAYSVFNENCVSIDGTLKAEQFEREIRYGAASVR
ncbi:SAYSvFN domain-containing protein 1 [Ostrinia nubilalis]|uniref:SAYSvFN domain-containing protein 1 n=1 Tax=Ostrinia nubilalis TaxID=29057 RepID=UPI003082464F